LVHDTFLPTLIGALDRVLGLAQLANESTAGSSIASLGTSIPEPSIPAALISLFSIGGLYNIMLVCFFTLGTLAILRNIKQYRKVAVMIAIGILGATLMIRIPLDINGLHRMQLPLSVFVAFVIGAGFYRLFRVPTGSIKRTLPKILVVVLLATASSGVAADDLYAIQSGPDLWETRTLPEPQKEFTAAEMASFQQTIQFSEQYDVSIGTDWHSELGLGRYASKSGLPTNAFSVEDEQITMDQDMLLYRQRWVDHTIRLLPERQVFQNLLMSSEWYNELVANENKVYTTGETGMLENNPNSPYLEQE
jgi:hypothetical protein